MSVQNQRLPVSPALASTRQWATGSHIFTQVRCGDTFHSQLSPFREQFSGFKEFPICKKHPWDSLRIVKGALIGQGRARLRLSALVYYQFAPGKAPWVLTPTCLTSSYQNAGSHVCVGTCSHSSQSWPRSHEPLLGNSDVIFSCKNPVSSKIRFRFICSQNLAERLCFYCTAEVKAIPKVPNWN